MSTRHTVSAGSTVSKMSDLAIQLEHEFALHGGFDDSQWAAFLNGLESGEIVVVERELQRHEAAGEKLEVEMPDENKPDGLWRVNTWVKSAILSGFKKGGLSDFPSFGVGFFDRPAFPPRHFSLQDEVRMVPGGSSVRRGSYVAPGVVIMPPSYINVGAYVDEGTMVDSHVLVGSCARIGKNVHLSAGVQIGGVLEPPQASPVIVEDEAFIGGMCGVFEGIVVRRRAVLAPGVILTKGTRIYDLVRECEYFGEVPENAVVVPGARPARGTYAREAGISLSTPCIVKYRDPKTDAGVTLESALRG